VDDGATEPVPDGGRDGTSPDGAAPRELTDAETVALAGPEDVAARVGSSDGDGPVGISEGRAAGSVDDAVDRSDGAVTCAPGPGTGVVEPLGSGRIKK
jgi:hypothetical protein